MGQLSADGLPLVVRARQALPSAPDRQIYPWLVRITWRYQGDNVGMPPATDRRQIQDFEQAVEKPLAQKGIGEEVASITGNHAKEWRYYTYDRDEFMQRLNTALIGRPKYPIDLQSFSDPDWVALSKLLPTR